MPSITLTQEDVKKNITFYKFWLAVFFILVLISFFYKSIFFIYHTAGLFLALTYWYFNYNALKTRGKILSKNNISTSSLRNSITLSKFSFVSWLLFSGLTLGVIAYFRPPMILDAFFFFIFILIILYRRTRFLSRSLKK